MVHTVSHGNTSANIVPASSYLGGVTCINETEILNHIYITHAVEQLYSNQVVSYTTAILQSIRKQLSAGSGWFYFVDKITSDKMARS